MTHARVDVRLLVIIPAFNEQAALGGLLHEIKALPRVDGLALETVVVDDGSADRTTEVARAGGARLLRLCKNLGIGGAVQAGLQLAHREGFDFAAQIDGDGQHPPSELHRLIEAARPGGSKAPTGASGSAGTSGPTGASGSAGTSESSGASGPTGASGSTGASESTGASGRAGAPPPDLVVGTRYRDGVAGGFRSTAMRRLGSGWLRLLLRVVTRLRVTDPTSGFRLYGARALALFAETYPYDFPEPESLAMACAARLHVIEVPVAMRERQGGQSSISASASVYYMLKVTVAVVLAYLRARRRPRREERDAIV
jgi:glycosyltransferase involved in cell wall biosynthesis